jgi:molybdopterin-guanine dinucleotide biosynthesis protein A
MPFLNPSLLRELVRRAESDKVWLPESHGPRGVEPLCGVYGTECAGEIERTLERGDRTVVQALSRVDRRILPLEVVGSYGDPDLLFLNVNRPADRSRAEQLLAERGREAAENGSR